MGQADARRTYAPKKVLRTGTRRRQVVKVSLRLQSKNATQFPINRRRVVTGGRTNVLFDMAIQACSVSPHWWRERVTRHGAEGEKEPSAREYELLRRAPLD